MQESTPENDGGKTGGLVSDNPVPRLLLKRSELAILRRMADRYPIVEGERQEVVDVVMDIARNAQSKRLKIAAVKAFVSMDKVNLDEMKVYLAAKTQAADDMKPAAGSVNVSVTTNVGVTVQMPDVSSPEFKALPAEERLRRLRDAIEAVSKN